VILLLAGIQTASAAQKTRLDEFLHLPPVMARLVGNPPVEIEETSGTKDAVVSIRRPAIKFPQSVKIDSIRIDIGKAWNQVHPGAGPGLARTLLATAAEGWRQQS